MTATLTTLVSFNGPDGANPRGDLVADAKGDLFGATEYGGPSNGGTVFEITKTAGGYAATPTILINFNGTNGSKPLAGLIADANGDLFGTTFAGGSIVDRGSVFEIAKTPTGFASQLTTLTDFNSIPGKFPQGGLLADSNGDLFGTTPSGNPPDFDGEVFEIKKTIAGYASTPTTLVSFPGEDESDDVSDLIADANGDLFGTTESNSAGDDGMVFEIAKTGSGYASTPTMLANFGSSAGLIADANGDLFGTTEDTVFEIKKTTDGYAPAPTILINLDNATSGTEFRAGLIADANGDLFGTTGSDGPDGAGTVFEIVKTTAGYASAPAIVASFDANGATGYVPEGPLVADAHGNLFGTAWGGGGSGDGTVFEVTDSGFATTATPPPTVTGDLLWQNASGQASIWDMDESTLVGGGPVSPNPGPSWTEIGTGDFNHDGHSDILWQNASGQASIWDMNGNSLIGGGPVTPSAGPAWKVIGTGDFTDDSFSDDILWQNGSSGQVSVWEMSGNSLVGGGSVTPDPGPAWKAIGTGDFNDDGHSDVLFQNRSSGQVSIWEMNGNTLIGGGPVSPNPGPAWKAIGTGDFNDDHHSDILFQNASTGQVSIWEMSGNKLVGGGPVSPNPGTSWHAIGTDGGSDILFQNSSGQASIWDMSGNSLVGGGPVSPSPGSSWRAVGLT